MTDSGDVLLLVSRSKGVTVSQEGRRARLGVGDMAVLDGARPHLIGGGAVITVAMPRHELPWPGEAIAELTAHRIDRDRVATRMVTALIEQAAVPTDPGDADALGVLLAKAALLLLEDALGALAARGRLSHRERLRFDVITYIEDHLGDPALGVVQVAQAHHISARTLHSLFAGGDSVAAFIRRRRIERCKRQLVNPVYARRPVAAIGATWGLPDPQHFGRVFRSMVGAPPSAYRTAALAVSPGSRDFTMGLPGRATWSSRPLSTVNDIATPDRRRPTWQK